MYRHFHPGQQAPLTLEILDPGSYDPAAHAEGILLPVECADGIGDLGEAGTIVFHLNQNAVDAMLNRYPYMPGCRVSNGVMDEFLGNPVEMEVCRGLEGAIRTDGIEMDGPSARSFEVLAKEMNAFLKGVIFKLHGQQLAGDFPHRFHYLLEIGLHGRDYRCHFSRVSMTALEAVQIQPEDRESLDEVVMNFGAHLGDDFLAVFHGCTRNGSIKVLLGSE